MGFTFNGVKPGEFYESSSFGPTDFMWIIKDYSTSEASHAYEDDTIQVHTFEHAFDTKFKTLVLNRFITSNSWYSIGYEDAEYSLSTKDPNRVLIECIFKADKIIGKMKKKIES